MQYYFDYQPGEIFACTADIGWITGHSYVVYGPLCNGATTVLFDNTATYPSACELGLDKLCWHNFENNRRLKELIIMLE